MLYECHVILRSVLSAVSRNRGRSWNVLPMDKGSACVCDIYIYIYIYICRGAGIA